MAEQLLWHKSQPALLAQVKEDLQARMDELNYSFRNGCFVADGEFPVHCNGLIIEKYMLELAFPLSFPADFPVVSETGGKIPREAARHVNLSGTLCLGVPEEICQIVRDPGNITLFLDRIVNDHLMQQVSYEGDKKYLGEHDHHLQGRLDYYGELFPEAKSDPRRLRRCIDLLLAHKLCGRTFCPICGTTRLKNCHLELFKQHRGKITARVLEDMREEIRAKLREPPRRH